MKGGPASYWLRPFLSSVNGKLNIDFCLQLKTQKLHFKNINLPNGDSKEHIAHYTEYLCIINKTFMDDSLIVKLVQSCWERL